MTRLHSGPKIDPAATLTAIVSASAALVSLPRGFWEGEEVRFAAALETFDPLLHQPEAPGYPLYVGAGKVLNVFLHDPLLSLLAISVVATVFGAVLFARAFALLTGNRWLGAAGALLFYLSPALLIHGPLPNPESLATALIGAALFAFARGTEEGGTERDALLVGAMLAAAVGCKPQLIVGVLVMLAASLPALRHRLMAIGSFVIVLGLAFVPLVDKIGVGKLAWYAQGEFVAARAASLAMGVHGRELVMRLIAHPWGPKLLSLPVLLLALIGGITMLRQRRWRLMPLVAFAIAQLTFALLLGDRADGAQPILQTLAASALLAAVAFGLIPNARAAGVVAMLAALAYGVGAAFYAAPVLEARRQLSPPAAALRHAMESMPRGSVVLYDPALAAYASELTGRAEIAPMRDFDRFVDRVDVPLFLLADSGALEPGARTFEWPESDAYGKVTTERYRVVSLIPLPPAQRFRARSGVHVLERTADGRQWRWLDDEAVLDLPAVRGAEVRLLFTLPVHAPVANRVTLFVNGVAAGSVDVPRGETVEARVPVQSGVGAELTIRSSESFTAERDARPLAVQLLLLERR